MVSFIDERREVYGVEPICQQLQIAPPIYYEWKRRETDPSLHPHRFQRDVTLRPEIERIGKGNRRVYGAERVWLQLNREGIKVACCAVERLMKSLGLQEVVVKLS